jgi:hypothetical protein
MVSSVKNNSPGENHLAFSEPNAMLTVVQAFQPAKMPL